MSPAVDRVCSWVDTYTRFHHGPPTPDDAAALGWGELVKQARADGYITTRRAVGSRDFVLGLTRLGTKAAGRHTQPSRVFHPVLHAPNGDHVVLFWKNRELRRRNVENL